MTKGEKDKKHLKFARCGYCKEFKDYPLFKVPTGPPRYEPDVTAASIGLNVKDGYVFYSWFCLPCTILFCEKLSEPYLRDGTIVEPTEEEKEEEVAEQKEPLFWNSLIKRITGAHNESSV